MGLVRAFLANKFITEATILLEYSHEVRYKALILFHTFANKHKFSDLISACILLSSKLESEEVSLKRVICVINYLLTDYTSKHSFLTFKDANRKKEACCKIEFEILRSFGFNLRFENLYEILFKLLEDAEDMMQQIVSKVNSVLVCPSVIKISSKEIIEMALSLCSLETNDKKTPEILSINYAGSCGVSPGDNTQAKNKPEEIYSILNKELNALLVCERKKYDLETFKEVINKRKIDMASVLDYLQTKR